MTDILLDDGLDLKIENGDLVTGGSGEQEVAAILALTQGNLKNAPFIGVGLTDFVSSENMSALKTRIRVQLKADGKTPSAVRIKDGKLQVGLK